MIGTKAQGIGILHGGGHGHGGIAMPDQVGLEGLGPQDLALCIEGREGDVLVGADLKA